GDADAPVILRDPVTSEKIRCREDLERVAPALEEAIEDEVHDRHARTVSAAALGPFTVAGTAAAMVGTGLWYPTLKFHGTATPTRQRQLYMKARDAFMARRFAEAREAFLALVINHGCGDAGIDDLPREFAERSLYYVGLSGEALHRDEEASEALRRF